MNEPQEFLWPEAVQGMQAAAVAAVEQARRTGTRLVIWRDGKIVEITPDEAEAMMKKTETEN